MLKKFLKFLIIKIIEIIEYYEYSRLNIELDETDISKKIIASNDLDLLVSSDKGAVKANKINITQPYKIWTIFLENGYKLNCADNHIVFGSNYNEIFISELNIGDYIKTDIGDCRVIKIEKSNHKISMYDLSINDDSHRYYTNNILSHNTVTSAITILYFCIFEVDKNIMIAANIKKTAEEIISKIQDIYYFLPFFLKPGVSNWTQSQITFGDTNCKIRCSAATKSAAIGFTIDVLFLDEFAHVDANIVEDYYRSIFPTVSAIKNSKIIITSTPKGYNKFWELLSGAEKPIGHKDKNTFAPMRVYWSQVPGRFVTYLKIDSYALDKNNITNEELFTWVRDLGFTEEVVDDKGFTIKKGIKMVTNFETNNVEIHIPNNEDFIPNYIKQVLEDKDWENPLSDYFRTLSFNKTHIDHNGNENIIMIKLLDICDISSWKEDAIKDIGGLDAFNQEYDLQFLSGAKMVLGSSVMNKIENSILPFQYIEIEHITSRLFLNYENLVWVKDRPDLFNIARLKEYYICVSIDISEGLNGDYSVINIFRLMPKNVDDFPLNPKTLNDLFKLEQIGIYHSNRTSVQELAELSYVLFFELFDDSKLGIVIEANNWGNEFTKTMREMYNGRNNYSSHVFFRYKHQQDATKTDIGIKLRQQKNKLVKDYENVIKRGDLIIHQYETLQEMTKFTKKITPTSYTFSAERGANDDIVMTLVELSTVFEHYKFTDLVLSMFETLPDSIKDIMNKFLKNSGESDVVDYSIIRTNVRNNIPNTNPFSSFNKNNIQSNPYSSNSKKEPFINPFKRN